VRQTRPYFSRYLRRFYPLLYPVKRVTVPPIEKVDDNGDMRVRLPPAFGAVAAKKGAGFISSAWEVLGNSRFGSGGRI
jgi:hypothetical protein